MEGRAELPPICLRPFIRAMRSFPSAREMFTDIPDVKCRSGYSIQQAEVTTYRTDEEGAGSFYLGAKSVTPDVALIH